MLQRVYEVILDDLLTDVDGETCALISLVFRRVL